MPDNSSSSVLFDIPQSTGGVNESEAILATLCQKSYLSLWSFSNLFTDEDLRAGKGSGKELCDVLVVFGDDVIIFSDKHIQFQVDKEITIAWPRWYKRAVVGSVNQLYGAMNWLKRFSSRAFLDARCTRPLPIIVPPSDRARFHLVAVTRGSLDACKKFFGGGLGTLLVNTNIGGDDHLNHPFEIGIPTPAKHFVHVFDEFSLEFLHQELDTIADFIEYLSAREKFLNNSATSVLAAGEEQLLSAYMIHMNGNQHSFLPSNVAQADQPSAINFDGSFYENLKFNPSYLAKKKADEASYNWDRLIEKFIKVGDPSIVRPELSQLPTHLEEGLRLIAGENRFRRRILISALTDAYHSAVDRPDACKTRIVVGEVETGPIYIFLIVPDPDDIGYDRYRRYRANLIEAYCRCAKLKFPKATTFIGLAFDHPIRGYVGASEDLIVFKIDELSDKDRRELEQVRRALGIFNDGMTMRRIHATEYPQTARADGTAISTPQHSRILARTIKATKNVRKKMAKASRKRNRN